MEEVHRDHQDDNYDAARSVLSGPRGTLTIQSIHEACKLLQEYFELGLLSPAIVELLTLWPSLVNVYFHPDRIPGMNKLAKLCQFFPTDPASTFQNNRDKDLIISTMAIVCDVLDFWKLTYKTGRLYHTLKQHHGTYICCITDKTTAIVIVPGCILSPFLWHLDEQQVLSRPLTTRRSHNQNHIHGLHKILEIYQFEKFFGLPSVIALNRHLLRNTSGKNIAQGLLHPITLQSIQTSQSRRGSLLGTSVNYMIADRINYHRIRIGKNVNDSEAADEPPVIPANHDSRPCLVSFKILQQTLNISTFQDVSSSPENAVAVVGMACSCPDFDSVEQFWNLINAGQNIVKELLSDNIVMGSVMGSSGHTRILPRVVRPLKTALVIQEKTISKRANLNQPSPDIEVLGKDRVAIPMHSQEWKTAKRAAVSNNYGASGSNDAPVIREDIFIPVISPPIPQTFLSDYPILISGESTEEVQSYCKLLGTSLSGKETASKLVDVAFTLAIQQNRSLKYSLTFVSSSIEELVKNLRTATSRAMDFNRTRSQEPYTVLCFGGQDGLIAHISKALYDNSILLQRYLCECSAICTEKLSLRSLFPTIFSTEPIEDVVTLHCILFSIQYACAKSWLDSGLKVDRIIGYGFGQLTALCVAGSLSLFETLRLVSERARLIQKHCCSRNGLMLAVEVPDVGRLLRLAQKQHSNFSVDIACHNGPRNFVIAGDEMSIQAVEKASVAFRAAFRSTRLTHGYAFQSRLLDGILPDLMQAATQLHIKPPKIPIEACSNVDDWSKITPEKIVRHSRQAVDLMDAVRRIKQRTDDPIIWLEAGSGSAIIPMIERIIDGNEDHDMFIATPLRYDANAQLNLAKATCRLWSYGLRVQFWLFYSS